MSEVTRDLIARIATAVDVDLSRATIEVSPIGAGQVAECHRILFVDGDRTVSVVVKSPSRDDTSRTTAGAQRLYLRETSFYTELLPDVRITTPALIFVEHDPETDDFVIVLEDLTPSKAIDQFGGLSQEEATIALRELAGLHAPTIGRTDLFERPWLGGVSVDLRPIYEAVMPLLFDQFLERYEDVIEPATRSVVERLRERLGAFSDYTSPMAAVVHGDYRTDNMIFAGRGGEVPLAIVDWQTVSVSSPMLDVAYFITTSLAPEDRARHEETLLTVYLEALAERDVEYPEELARREYARFTLQPVVMLVAASVLVERTERGDRMFLTMINRAVQAVEQWSAFDELDRDAAA